MQVFSIRHPVLFGILVILAAFLAAAVCTALFAALSVSSDAATSLARIAVGILLLVLFRSAFPKGPIGSGFRWGLPALLFVLWNIIYHIQESIGLADGSVLIGAVLIALAPAIFEEVLFRGILLGKCRDHGMAPMVALLVSSGIFAVIHLTNAVSGDLVNALVQVGYAFVVGLLFGAVYLKTGDLLSVMVFHFLIDYSSHLFVSDPAETGTLLIVLFALLLIAVAVYALRITPKSKDRITVKGEPEP